jgi:hypothetical protein
MKELLIHQKRKKENKPATSTKTSGLSLLCLCLYRINRKPPKRRITIHPPTTPRITPIFGLLKAPVKRRKILA